jgi:outer membrane protein assembly factor BamB
MKPGYLAMSFTLIISLGSTQSNEWPILHNTHHTGFSPTTILKPPLKVKWISKVQSTFKSGPVIAQSRVVVQSRKGYIFCLDAETGEQIWRYYVKAIPYNYKGAAQSGPCIWNGRVYAAFHSSSNLQLTGMRCFDLNSGDVLWKKDVGYTDFGVRYSPQVSNGKLFFISNREITGGTSNLVYHCQVQAWDALTGDTLWTYTLTTSEARNTSIVVAGDTVFASSGTGKTVALRPDGSVIWESTQHYIADNHGANLQYVNGRLVMLAPRPRFLDPSDGSQLLQGSGDYYTKAAAFMNGFYWTSGYGGWPRKYNESTGSEVNTSGYPNLSYASGCGPPVAANGYVYVGFGHPGSNTDGHTWHAVDEDRNIVWTYMSSSNNCPTMAIAYDRLYCAAGIEGLVYCFENE